MQNITIGFSSPIKFKLGAEALKIWMRSEFSHTYVKLHISSINRKVVYHAAHGMVHFINYDEFLKENVIINEFTLTVDDLLYKELLNKCIDLSGIKYGYGELTKIFITDVLHNIGINILTYNGRGYICSELVAEFLTKATKIKFNKPKHLLTPMDIYNKIKEI